MRIKDTTYNDLNNEFVDIAMHESAKSIMQRKITRLEKRMDQDPNPDETLLKIEDLQYKIQSEDRIINAAENTIILNQVALDKTIIDESEVLKIVDAGIVRRNAFGVQPHDHSHDHPHPHPHRHPHRHTGEKRAQKPPVNP